MTHREISQYIKQESIALGFLSCGISKARFLEEEAPRLESWLKSNMHGEMSYMENYFDKRLDPRKLVEDCKSVISLSFNYYPEEQQRKDSYKISKYAYAEDYHDVIKRKLNLLIKRLQEKIGEINARSFVDSAPVMDKVWAKESGLGWVGKHSNLISKTQGSFFFLAEILIDIVCEYDQAFQTDHCGTCTKCIDACPTEAIVSPYLVDGSKCISYFTIELKNEFNSKMKLDFDDWVFGCDVCQDVCPWNRFSIPHQHQEFMIKDEIKKYSKKDWEEITEEKFKIIFKNSPIKRSKFEGFKRNILYNKKG
jgi:epoxyqueuosine reductase